MISAPNDIVNGAPWGCAGNSIPGGTPIDLGSGILNTNAIAGFCAQPWIASWLCSELVLNGYDDWYLPTKNELELVFLNKSAIGGFTNTEYWSSSEYYSNVGDAWSISFYDGNQYGRYKSSSLKVRAIRSF